MHWLYLFIAGLFEIGWPLGFKLSIVTDNKAFWIGFAIISMGLSGFFLWLAQKQISIGTAYIIWTGIGAIGTFVIGIIFFKDPVNTIRILSAFLIIVGIVGLKISH